MLALACYGVIRGLLRSRKGNINGHVEGYTAGKIKGTNAKSKSGEGTEVTKKRLTAKDFLLEELAWIVFLIIVSVPAAVVVKDIYNYLTQGLVSTVISFGGGEAYINIAETVFVSNGFIPSEVFYGQILPIANALPGPILSKVLAAIGYYFAYSTKQSVVAGLLLALAGFAASLAASCGVYFLIFFIYSRFESLELFQTLKKWILPIVSGLLLTTILSMLYENFNIVTEHNGTVIIALVLSAAIFALLMLLHKKYHLHDVLLILISGAASLLVCNLL